MTVTKSRCQNKLNLIPNHQSLCHKDSPRLKKKLESEITLISLKNIRLLSVIFQEIKTVLQFSSVSQSCPPLCDPMNHSTPGLPVHHQLPESTQTHVHWVSDAIQPSHPLSPPSPPAPNPSQNQGFFQWVNSFHEVAEVLEYQLQHQSFQWTPRTHLL